MVEFLMKLFNRLTKFLGNHEIFCLFCFVFLVYNINGRPIGCGDTIPASLLPFSILDNFNLYLDQFSHYFEINYFVVYWAKQLDGHLLSAYPIVLPVLATPLYLIPFILIKLANIPIDMFNPAFALVVSLMEKTVASIIASLSVVFVFLSIKELLTRRFAIIIALIYAFATNTWTISSQALWQHGLVELFLTVSIYLVLLNEKKNSNNNIIGLGLVCGCFVFNRPVDSILLLPILYYIFNLKDRRIAYFLCALLFSCAPFLLYNLYYFNCLFGGYSSLASLIHFNSGMITGFFGLLFSPSRGLFIYTPILLFSILGYLKIPIMSGNIIKKFLLISGFSVLVQILVYSAFPTWWAGWCFGPRFLTGILPFLLLFFGIYINNFNFKINKNYFIIFILLILLTWSFFTQIVGAFYYPNGNWDGDPNVDLNPEKLWKWDDSQLERSYKAGSMQPIFPGEIRLLLDQNLILTGIVGSGWHGIEFWDNIPTRWMKGDAELLIYSVEDNTSELNMRALSFNRSKTLEIYLNNFLLAEKVIGPMNFINISVPISLKKGKNTLRFHILEGCNKPIDIQEPKSFDSRCLGVAIQYITVDEWKPCQLNYIQGFYDIESWSGTPTRWMQDNATFLVNSSENRVSTLKLDAYSFYQNRTLKIYSGDDLLNAVIVPSGRFVEIEASVHLVKGTNIIKLHVPEGCNKPANIQELNSTDNRCLSVAIQNIALGEWKPYHLNYGEGFYDIESWSGVPSRWMKGNATLLINSSQNLNASLSLNAQSFYRNRTLQVIFKGVPKAQIAVVPTGVVNVSLPLELEKGANAVQVHVLEGCERPCDIIELNNPDPRCLSIALQNLSIF